MTATRPGAFGFDGGLPHALALGAGAALGLSSRFRRVMGLPAACMYHDESLSCSWHAVFCDLSAMIGEILGLDMIVLAFAAIRAIALIGKG